mgnify:CR=1 FL=1
MVSSRDVTVQSQLYPNSHQSAEQLRTPLRIKMMLLYSASAISEEVCHFLPALQVLEQPVY